MCKANLECFLVFARQAERRVAEQTILAIRVQELSPDQPPPDDSPTPAIPTIDILVENELVEMESVHSYGDMINCVPSFLMCRSLTLTAGAVPFLRVLCLSGVGKVA